jgi:hypothetical protein
MSYDKIDVIAGTLDAQADKMAGVASAAMRAKQELSGAKQALRLMSKQVHGLVETLTTELAAAVNTPGDGVEPMGETEAEAARAWVRRYLARVETMCSQSAAHQESQELMAEGRYQCAVAAVTSLRRDTLIERAKAERREEIEGGATDGND